MSYLETVKLPDIGDTDSVEVIEVLVQEGDTVQTDDSLITVESDKASMEIPSPVSGVVTKLLISQGSIVSTGSDILVIDVAQDTATGADAEVTSQSEFTSTTIDTKADSEITASNAADQHVELLVIGAGPGGYTAAFRAADLGKKVMLVERYPTIGGVCLNVGCIPSKALLHTALVINEAEHMAAHGVSFGKPQIDLDKLRNFKSSVINQLTSGLSGLAGQRSVEVRQGYAKFTSSHTIELEYENTLSQISFDHAVIAVGSRSIRIPGFPYEDSRLMDSTGALELNSIPSKLLVIGGGIIGLELGSVYAALGSTVSVVELADGLMPGCDRDLVKPLQARLKKQFENIYLSSKVTAIESTNAGLKVTFEGSATPDEDTFDNVLLAVGRAPNGAMINAEAAGVNVDERGFIAVDGQLRTNVDHIFAIGDVVGQPMLAHKAAHEGKIAAEAICGQKAWFDATTIPSVAYTDPEVAWMGLTETEAMEKGIDYKKAVFPWAASGRSLSIGRNEGLTKVLFNPENNMLLGAGIVGQNAGELIAELVLALEMGADMEDISLTVHPHPTLSETVGFACEVAEGTVTDIYLPRR